MVVFWRAVSVSREDSRADKDGVAPVARQSTVRRSGASSVSSQLDPSTLLQARLNHCSNLDAMLRGQGSSGPVQPA